MPLVIGLISLEITERFPTTISAINVIPGG
jgi:hypothetical protein